MPKMRARIDVSCRVFLSDRTVVARGSRAGEAGLQCLRSAERPNALDQNLGHCRHVFKDHVLHFRMQALTARSEQDARDASPVEQCSVGPERGTAETCPVSQDGFRRLEKDSRYRGVPGRFETRRRIRHRATRLKIRVGESDPADDPFEFLLESRSVLAREKPALEAELASGRIARQFLPTRYE